MSRPSLECARVPARCGATRRAWWAILLAATVSAAPFAPPARSMDLPPAAERLLEVFAGAPPRSVDELRALEERFRTVAATAIAATVGVRAGAAQGSGVIIANGGYVLTAGHVSMRSGRRVTLILHDGRTVRGETLGANLGMDSGLIRITEEGSWPHVEMGASKDLRRGQWCIATGHPGGYEDGRAPPVRAGRILANRRDGITTDCALVSGDSGGPLFDMDGRVIGIHSRIGHSLASNVHVPIDAYTSAWERLASGETWDGETRAPRAGDPFLGIIGDPATEAAKIGSVIEGSPAESAGFRPGDRIVRFGGKEVETFADLARLVRSQRPGDVVEVDVERDGAMLGLKVAIGTYEG